MPALLPFAIMRRHARRCLALWMLLTLTATCGVATAAAQPLPDSLLEIREGRITNASDRPFTFRLARRFGQPWTAPFTLQPGEHLALSRQEHPWQNELLGIVAAGVRDRYVVVEYREYGGAIRARVSARSTQSADVIVPYHFYVVDADGFGRIIQARTLEEAQTIQAELQKQPQKTADQIRQDMTALRANHVLYFVD